MAEEDTVKVEIVFADGISDHGKKKDLPVAEAHRLVRDGRVKYSTEAQERKAHKLLGLATE